MSHPTLQDLAQEVHDAYAAHDDALATGDIALSTQTFDRVTAAIRAKTAAVNPHELDEELFGAGLHTRKDLDDQDEERETNTKNHPRTEPTT